MVNYAEEADFVGKGRRSRRSPAEIAARKAALAEQRSEAEWHQYARDTVYRQLAMRDHSTMEVAEKLRKNLVPEEIISATIDTFAEAGLLDDEKFADTFVRQRFDMKVTSRRVLREELSRKGITGPTAEVALEQVNSADELEKAIDFACRRVRSMRSLEPQVKKRRLYGQLSRRGFSPQQVSQAVEVALAKDTGGEDPSGFGV